jgi:hypothetical protein
MCCPQVDLIYGSCTQYLMVANIVSESEWGVGVELVSQIMVQQVDATLQIVL